MSEKVHSIRERARDEIAAAEYDEAMNTRERERVGKDGEALGAIKAIAVLGSHLEASAFREFQRFIEDERWRSRGYKTVVEFLQSPDSPMTKSQYYERLNAIGKEGDATFDLLNALDVSLRGRKLLGEGEIRVEENEVFVGENRIPIADRAQVRSLIATLVESRSTAQDTIEKQSRKIEKGTKDNLKLKKKLHEAELRGGSPVGTPHGQALLTLVGAYTNLRDEVIGYRDAVEPGSEGDLEFHKFQTTVVEQIGAAFKELIEAFDITEPAHADDLGLSDDEAAALLEN